MNFERMRALVLDQAIRGELVPQFVEEGTVEQVGVLLREVPFEIPESWKWIRLDEMATIVRGGSPRPIKSFITEREDGLNWIKIGDAERGTARISHCAEKIVPEGLKKTRFIQKGSLLLTNSMSFGYPYILDVDGCIHDGWLAFSDFESVVNRDYLYYALLSPYCRSIFIAKAAGAVVKNLNIDKVKEIFIPVPPLHEQDRIVSALEEAFAEIDRAEKAYEELQALAGVLRGQILQEAIQGKLVQQLESEKPVEQIGDAPEDVPFAIPEKWKWATLNDVGKWKAGGTPSRSVNEYYENGTIPWFKTGDLNDGKINSVEEFITQKAVENSSAHINPVGAVLIAMYGATIGKLGVLEMKCATNQACCACVVKDDLIDNWYLFYYLLSQRNKFIALGAGGAQPNISRTKIIHYPIPLPPLEEQKRIVLKVEELLKQVGALSGR